MWTPGDGKAIEDGFAGKSVEDLLLMIGDRDLGQYKKAMDMVAAMGFDAVRQVLERAVRNNGNADLRNGAMEALVRFGRESVPALIVLLRDADEEVRNFSAVMLGEIGVREAVNPLIDALGDAEVNVSHAAAEALGKIGDDAAVFPLVGLLQGDFWLQYAAVTALGAIGDRRAVPHLLPLLHDGLLGEAVIIALGKIGDRRALPSLVNMLCDSRGKTIAAAAEATVAVVEKGDSDTKAELVSAMNNRGIGNLLGLFSGNNAGGKGAAAKLLGLVGEKAVIPALLTLLEEHNNEEVVNEAIMHVLSSSPLGGKTLLGNTREIRTLVLSLLRNLNFQGQAPAERTKLSRRWKSS